jgi:hypothetical protein
VVSAGPLVLALLDGMFARFRSSCGRTGAVVRHRWQDLLAHVRGRPRSRCSSSRVATEVIDVTWNSERVTVYVPAGRVMIEVHLPYAGLILAGYAVLTGGTGSWTVP